MASRWAGPSESGPPWPTLGFHVAGWMESTLVIPDKDKQGQPYILTPEQLRFVLKYFRIHPITGERVYDGGQLRRSVKWGKDPLGAGIGLAVGCSETKFDGWDAYGQPVARPVATPLIALLGTVEDQTENTWRPLLNMIRNSSLIDIPGMDAGETRVVLPNGGKIEPFTTSARARMGAPMDFAILTESHLFTLQGGYRKVAGTIKQNIAGMNGHWLELTNAFDPTESSEAQATDKAAQDGDTAILIDNVPSVRVEDLYDDEELERELRRQYGDSLQERGGWVNLERIKRDVRRTSRLESDRRRYFLNEIVEGALTFVSRERWDLLADETNPLRPGDMITLGFDGSKNRDSTALIACRVSDGKKFEIAIWERPLGISDWRVPSIEVDEKIKEVFEAYNVILMYADPYRWQDYLDNWSRLFPNKIVEFPTNVEQRMDYAIERFLAWINSKEACHDGSETLSRHIYSTVLIKGSRKKSRPGSDDDELSNRYMGLTKRSGTSKIDGSIATVLSHLARGKALEKGLDAEDDADDIEPFVHWG